MAIFHKTVFTNFFGDFITKWDFGLSYNLQPSFAWYNSFQSSYGCFCGFFYSDFSFEACISFIYDPILIKPGQNVDILEVNNSYYYPFMIKPQLQASIEQNVPKMPLARPFFVVFASGVLIYASILTKLGQNVDIHEVNNSY